MKPQIEALEERAAPSDTMPFHITELAAPPAMNWLPAVELTTDLELFLGQVPGMGVSYQGPNQIIEFRLTPGQWQGIMGDTPPTTARTVVAVAGGEVPVILAPNWFDAQELAPGLLWEETCFSEGWWDQDPPGVRSTAEIGPGPENGQGFAPVNLAAVDALLLSGDPNWWAALLW